MVTDVVIGAAAGGLVALALGAIALAVYHRNFVVPRLRAFSDLVDGTLESPVGGLDALATSFGARTNGRLAVLERQALERDLRVGFLRYNSFSDVGSDLSFSLALVTERGDGVLLTSIYSREETRTYGKAVEGWVPAQGASDEEKRALERARAAEAFAFVQ